MSDPATDPCRAPEWPLAGVRIYVGVVFIVAGIGQLAGADPWGPRSDWPTSLLQYVTATRSHVAPFYAGFFESVLVANKGFFGTLMPVVHIAVGLPLLAGVATRVVAGAALFCLLNYMAMLGVAPYHPGPISALSALTLAVLLARPDEVWSLRTLPALRRRPRGEA